MSKLFDVITFSDMCVDLIISGAGAVPRFGQVEQLVDDYTLELGGSCNLFACQCARLGLRAAVLGRLGVDPFGELALRRLNELGVDTRHVIIDPALKTGIGVALCPPGDRAILTYTGTIDGVYPQDITDSVLASTRHVHHASHYLHTRLQGSIAEIFQRAHRLGASTSLDTNWDPAEGWDGDVKNILRHTDLFMPNAEEALRISGRDTLAEAAMHFLGWGARVIVVKVGAKGARAYTEAGCVSRSVKPASGGDSIGAGDSFDAGFLAAWLRGLPIARCLQAGNRCGRSVASHVGGLAGQITSEEAGL